MKRVVILSGPPGVGKTTISRSLFESIDGCAWLDADWCWMVNPWIPKNDSEKRVVEETYRRIIKTYLQNDNIKTIIFNWVIKADWMFDLVTEDLDVNEVIIKKIVLVCDKDNHVERMKADGRRDELVENPEDMERYRNLDAYIADVTNDSIEENTMKVMRIIEG